MRFAEKGRPFLRAAAGILLPVGIVLGCYAALHPEHSVGCRFYEWTGLYCPGCGSGRALSAILHGDVRAAFSYNPLFILMGAPALAVFLHEYLRFVFPGLKLKPIYIGQRTAWAAVFVIAAFWILRNTQTFSFLAP